MPALLATTACTFTPVFRGDPPTFEGPQSTRLEGEAPFPNWPIPPDEVEALIRSREMEASGVTAIGTGLTGADKVTLDFPDRGVTADFKWKEMPRPHWLDALPIRPDMLDGVNNSPRKEIAAWKIQRLFLEPEDYVVPTSVAHCIEVDGGTVGERGAEPTLAGSRCLLGVLSLWIREVELPAPLLDDDRFVRDPLYATYLADFNTLAHVIEHHDGREGNFLVSKDDDRRQVFAIDNGVSFGGLWYNWFVPNWSAIRVPALRRVTVDRLRGLGETDLIALLGVVAELHLDEAGLFHVVDPGPNLDDTIGVRYRDGVLQLGLTRKEIEAVWERIEDLIEQVDEGDLATF